MSIDFSRENQVRWAMTDRRETTFIGLVVTLLVVGVSLSFGLAHHQQVFGVQATSPSQAESLSLLDPLVPIDSKRLTRAESSVTDPARQEQWSTSSSRAAVEDFYQQKLPQTGWQIDEITLISAPHSSSIVATKQNQKHYISIGSDQTSKKTTITISRVIGAN